MIRREIKDHCRRYAFRVGDVITITLDTRARTEVDGTVPTFGDGRLQFAVNDVPIVEFVIPLTKSKKKKKKFKGKKKASKTKKVTTASSIANPTFYDFHIVAAIRDAHTFISVA